MLVARLSSIKSVGIRSGCPIRFLWGSRVCWRRRWSWGETRRARIVEVLDFRQWFMEIIEAKLPERRMVIVKTG
jgi:hypothetical protein